MKNLFAIFVLIAFFSFSGNIFGQQVSFLFNSTKKTDTEDQRELSNGFNQTFLVDAVQSIQKEFPCVVARYLPDSKLCINEMLLWGTPAFGNQDVGPKIKKLVSYFANSDYWVNFSLYPINKYMAVAEIKCSDKKGKILAEFTINIGIEQIMSNEIIEPVNKLVKQLLKYEICPYTGSINVEVKTERTDKKTESYPVYCNGMDGIYKLDWSVNKTSSASWNLNKTDKFQTSGTVTYNLREETKTDEQNDCFTCPSGRLGPRWYKEKVIKTAKIEGLSNESVADDQQIEDARTEITFLENGTYTVKVTAASKKGDLKLKTGKHAEGTCSNENPPLEDITKKADIPLDEIFGPFNGTGEDKVLNQKETITREDPITKEKTTITFDFNLKRD